MMKTDDFRVAMQRFAASATAITTLDDGVFAGLMATAVCSLSAEPPSLVVCINRDASAHDAILRSGILGVSLIPDNAEELAMHFAQAKGAARFERGDWTTLETGAPILLDAPAAFDCRISQVYDGYSHSIIVADIKAFHFAELPESDCLIWHRRAFARLSKPTCENCGTKLVHGSGVMVPEADRQIRLSGVGADGANAA